MRSGKHEYRVIDSKSELPRIDHPSYDALEGLLCDLGFAPLGDVEDLTLTAQLPLMRTFMRIMASHDGTSTAAVYEIRMVGPLSMPVIMGFYLEWIPVVDFDTELTDGTFVSTSYGLWRSLLRQCPTIGRRLEKRLPPVASLFKRHTERQQTLLKTKPGVAMRVVRTLKDALLQQERLEGIRNIRG